MGWSVCAQSAELHSVWGAYNKQIKFWQLGALKVSPKGFVDWEGRWILKGGGLLHYCSFMTMY